MGRGADKRAEQMAQENQRRGQEMQQQGINSVNKYSDLFADKINGILSTNPWLDPAYKRDVTAAASSSASGTEKAAEQRLEDYSTRTGENSSNITASVDEMRRARERDLNDTLTSTTIADHDKRQAQVMDATRMLGSIPANYGAVIGAGNSNIGAAANLQGQAAQAGSWFDSLVNAGVSAAGAALGCPVKGSLILMADGSEKPVEDLRAGDVLAQLGGSIGFLTERPLYMQQPAVEVETEDGSTRGVSESHAYAVPYGGYVEAHSSLGWAVAGLPGKTTVKHLKKLGVQEVYCLKGITGNKTYCADGVWSLE